MPSPRTGTDEYVGLVVCVVSDNKMGYAFPATSGLLAGGHMLAVSVCLTQLQLAPEIRESRAAETISFCTHSNELIDYATLCDATSPPTYPARKYGINHRTLFIYTNIYTKFTQIDRSKVEIVHILVIIAAVTQIRGNRQKSRYKAKITVITVTVNS